MTTRLHLPGASLGVLALTIMVAQATAAPGTADDPVEITDEPMHVVRMQNDVIRVYDATVPGGSATLFHKHALSGVGIDMNPVRLSIEKVGTAASEETTKPGDFFPVKASPPYVHRVINLDRAAYRAIVAERLDRVPLQAGNSTLADAKGYRKEVETDLVLAYRLTLRPGDSTNLHSIRASTLMVAVSGGLIAVGRPGTSSTLMSLAPGDLEWIAETRSLVISNHGVSDYVAAFFEWK